MKCKIFKNKLMGIIFDKDKSRLEKIKDDAGVVFVEIMDTSGFRTYEQIKAFKGLSRLCYLAKIKDYMFMEQYEDYFKIKCGIIKRYEYWENGKLKFSESFPAGKDNIRPVCKSCAYMNKKEMRELIYFQRSVIDENLKSGNFGTLQEKVITILNNMETMG